MMHKPIPNYLLLLLIFSNLTGALISSPALSASIIMTKEKLPYQLQKHKLATKLQHSAKKLSDIKPAVNLSDFIKPINPRPAKQKLIQKQQHIKQASNKKPQGFVQNSLLKQGKQFLSENQHNDFIQESLIIFNNTKQILQETDLILQNLSQHILISLQLEQLLKNNQLLIMQKNNARQSNAQQLYKDRPSNIDIVTSSSDLYIAPTNEYTLALLYEILQIKNLFYLIAMIVFYCMIKGSIKLILFKKQRKQKYRDR